MPDRLIGRDQDVALLGDTLKQALDGECCLTLVTGPSGIGKSRLVQELRRRVVRHGAWFVSGKCDPLRRGQPYLALTRALTVLVGEILSEPDDILCAWRDRILDAVGPNGRLLTDVIPDLKILLGDQALVPELPATETAQRFRRTFRLFIQAIAAGGRTLVIFIDDMQWVDVPSVALIESLLRASQTHSLMLIGAYRDQEVKPDHPLMRTVAALEQAGITPRRIELGPLSDQNVAAWVSDTLGDTQSDSADLAAAVIDKTRGNPFFIRQFLHRLHDDRIIRRGEGLRGWVWDSAGLAASAYTDNVVDLMVGSIRELPPVAQRALAEGAFVGSRIELRALADVLGSDIEDVAAALRVAVERGLLVPEDDALRVLVAERPDRPAWFRFLHDRVQEAAHVLVPKDQQPALHLRIGRQILAHDPDELGDAELFRAVSHLTLAQDLITDPDERVRVAALNLRAGHRAVAAVAHGLSLACNIRGLDLLGEDAWERHYDMALGLHTGAAQAGYLTGRLDDARFHSDQVLEHAVDVLDTVRIYELAASNGFMQHRFSDSLGTGREALALLGYPLQDPPDPSQYPQMLDAIAAAQGGRSVAELIDMPMVSDARADAAMRVMAGMVPTICGVRPDLYAPLVSMGMQAFLSKGMTPAAASLCTGYGLILGVQGAVDLGAEFGRLGMSIVNKFPNSYLGNPAILQYAFFVMHWTQPLRELMALHRHGQVRCRELGDNVNASFCAMGWLAMGVLSGTDLCYLAAEYGPLLAAMKDESQFASLHCASPFAQVVACLVGDAKDPGRLVGDVCEVDKLHAELESVGFALGVFYLQSSALYLACLFQRWDDALDHARLVEAYRAASTGSATQPWSHAFWALALIRSAESASGDARAALLAEFDKLIDDPAAPASSLRTWGTTCGVNHRQRLLLLQAERARLDGDQLAAMGLYDQAIDAAHDNGYVNDVALIAELAAGFHHDAGRSRIARAYVDEALSAYQKWGATAKVDDLRARFADLLASGTATGAASSSSSPASAGPSAVEGAALDVATVTRASAAIAGELVLDRLIERLMRMALENAGARRCVLVMPRDTGLRVTAVGQVECKVEGQVDDDTVRIVDYPLKGQVELSLAVIHYVARTLEDVVIGDARTSQRFAGDGWLHGSGVRSVLCTALVNQGKLSAIVYLENDLAADAFTPQRVELLRVLAGHAAIALDHARLIEELRDRTLELEQTNSELTELDRLRDQFLANTSHELRTPLHGIIGIAESLLEGATGDLAQATRQNLGMVVSSGHRLSNLVNDLLDFSTLQHRRIELVCKAVDLRSVASKVLALSAWLVGDKAVDLNNEIGPALPAVDADEDRLEQILTNLVGNAVKFTERGSVSVRAVEGVLLAEDRPGLRIEVADTGVGIRQAVQDRIFDSFEQADGSTSRLFGGTGLGLSVAKALVSLHGGEIGVESQPGRGSVFWFTLPISGDQPQQAETRLARLRIEPARHALVASSALTQVDGSPRILVVDDDPTNRQVLINQLSVRGFQVESAVSGAHALTMIDQGYLPDLVLLDVMMPTITGYDLTRTLRKRFLPSELPIVLLTAKTLVRDLIKGLEAGANDYLTKPFSSGELLARLRTHLRLAQVHRAVGRFVPADFLRLLDRESIVDVRLGDGVERTMSVLFSDIRSFTAMSEGMTPKQSFQFINEYLSYVEPVVMAHNGFIDKFIGDAVMALFDHGADDAVKAGLGMLTQVDAYNTIRRRRGQQGIQVGIGINSGRLMLGTVGGKGRMDGTVVSDAVNLGARLEKLTKRYGVRMLVTEHTHALLADPGVYRMRVLDRIAVRGKQVPVTLYDVFETDPPNELLVKLETRTDFERGVSLYHSGDWLGAHQAFSRVVRRCPTDLAAERYVERCRRRVRITDR
ncbi:MAG: AAA family ATPase [Oligoflexia bacterium]|nr:AAA family ATPase [Oligoflexia bacterium]